MTSREFIFSNKISTRIKRHLVFWAIYCLYFYVQSLPPRSFEEFYTRKPYYIALINLCCFAPVFILATYFFIYYLLPNTLKKKKYFLFIAGFLIVYITGTLINYYTAEIFLYYTGFFPNTFQHRIEMSNYNTRWGIIIATVALGIKLSKGWYQQQKENLEIMKKKSRAEIQLQKARIHPELLLKTLETIHADIEFDSAKTSSLILNLSDLLSYSLYESGKKLVPLEKELLELRHLIFLEEQQEKNKIKMQVELSESNCNKYIAPMIIIKLVEDSITLLHKTGSPSCILNISIFSDSSSITLNMSFIDSNKKLPDINKWDLLTGGIQNRMKEYYPEEDFLIGLNKDDNTAEINLKVKVADNPGEISVGSVIKSNTGNYDFA